MDKRWKHISGIWERIDQENDQDNKIRGKDGLYDTLCLRAERAALPESPFNYKWLLDKNSNPNGCAQMEGHLEPTSLNPLSPKIHIPILQIDLYTFLLRIVEIIWSKIKAFSLW